MRYRVPGQGSGVMATFSGQLSDSGASVFQDPASRSLLASTFTSIDVDASWEITLTIGARLFRSGLLSTIGFVSGGAATVPAPDDNDCMGVRIKRNGLSIWQSPFVRIVPNHQGGVLGATSCQITVGLPPFPLYPGDEILIAGPTLDTNGTPTVNLNTFVGFYAVEF